MIVEVTNGRDATKASAILCGIEAMLASGRNVGRDGARAIAHFVASEPIEQGLARARRQRAILIFAAEVTLVERRIGEKTHLLAIEDLAEPNLEGAVDQV